jgi:hypothetical protein
MFDVNNQLPLTFAQHLSQMQPGEKRYRMRSKKHIPTNYPMLNSMIKLENDSHGHMVFFVSSGERSKDNRNLKGTYNKITKGCLVHIANNGQVVNIIQNKILRQERQYAVHTQKAIQDIQTENQHLSQYYSNIDVPVFIRKKQKANIRVASIQPDLGQSLYEFYRGENNGQYDAQDGLIAIDEALQRIRLVLGAHNDLKPKNFACSIDMHGKISINPLDFPGIQKDIRTYAYLHTMANSPQNDDYACFLVQYEHIKHSKQYCKYALWIEAIRQQAQQAFLMCLVNKGNDDQVYQIYKWAKNNFQEILNNRAVIDDPLVSPLIATYQQSNHPFIVRWRMLETQCDIINNMLQFYPPCYLSQCALLVDGSPQYHYLQSQSTNGYKLPKLSQVIIDMLQNYSTTHNVQHALNFSEIHDILHNQTDDTLTNMLQYCWHVNSHAAITLEGFMQHCYRYLKQKNYLPYISHACLTWDGTQQVVFFLLNCITFGAFFFISTMQNDDHLSTHPIHVIIFIGIMIGNFATTGILTAMLGAMYNLSHKIWDACPNTLGHYECKFSLT